MEYTTDIAEKIAKKLNVPTATLLTWKNRKKIPNKYFNPDGSIIDQLPDNISDADKYRIKNVYELDMFNFSQFKSVTVQQIADIDRGKGTLTKKEYIA